jgi:hypothetical protein
MNEEILQLLDAAIAETRRLGRADLAARLGAQRDQVTSGAWHVLVAGEFKKGKSALVNALLGVPVCGADAAAFTAVPTIIRYATEVSAEIVLDSGQRRRIDIRTAARYSTSGTAEGDIPLSAVEVALPRELLRDGLVLVDTPGIGGGFAAAQAAATMRAMSLADSVLIVSDASQEYTAAEVEFLRRADDICPHLLCLLTKTDFYPEWQKILEINRGHLRRAGLKVEILPVSAALRDVAVETGDAGLNTESGFPTLVTRLRGQLAVQRSERSAGPATEAVRSCMRQVAGTLSAEHEALTQPEQRGAVIARLEQVQERAQKLTAPSSRWLNTMQDRFADLQSRVEEDLQARIRKLDTEAGDRIAGRQPGPRVGRVRPVAVPADQRRADRLPSAPARAGRRDRDRGGRAVRGRGRRSRPGGRGHDATYRRRRVRAAKAQRRQHRQARVGHARGAWVVAVQLCGHDPARHDPAPRATGDPADHSGAGYGLRGQGGTRVQDRASGAGAQRGAAQRRELPQPGARGRQPGRAQHPPALA